MTSDHEGRLVRAKRGSLQKRDRKERRISRSASCRSIGSPRWRPSVAMMASRAFRSFWHHVWSAFREPGYDVRRKIKGCSNHFWRGMGKPVGE